MYGLRYRQLFQQLKHIFFLIFMVSIALGRCSKKPEQTNKINICVSILPLAEFTEKIGGDLVQVSVMVPAGITPHSYEPTAEQLADLNNTAIYIKVGTPIEFELAWLDKILSINKSIVLCNASQNIALPELEIDPHIWLSPLNAQIMVENIYDVLIEADAKNTAFYSSNKQNYIKELVELNERIQMLLNGKKNRKFLVYHPAWGYFARAYDLKQISIEKEGKEPTAKGILRIIEQAKKDNIHIIFAAPQMSTKSAQVIAKEIQGKVIMIDPLEKNYILNLMNVAEQFSRSMD